MSFKQSSSAKLTSATMPKSSPRSNKNFVKSGRKLSVTSTSAHLLQKKTSDSPTKKKVEISENASAEELDRMLDEDAIALLNIKKEIQSSQQQELNKIKNKLLNVKKEYDTLYVANNFKATELQSYKDREIQLSGVEEASYTTATTVQEQVENFNQQTEIVLEELAAEQRTLKMLTLMSKRLDKEIGQCRVDTSKTVTQLDHVKHDINIAENNLQNNKQELIEQEQKLEKLSTTIQSRKQERNQKINMLHNLSVDGENSVQRLQTSLMESSKFVSRGRSNNRTRGSTGRVANTAGSRANRSRHGLTGGSMGEGMLEGMEGLDEFDDLIEGTSPLKRLTSTMIQDIVNRYKSQSLRMEKLKELDNELRINIIKQQDKKKELTEHLSHTVFRIQQLASSRQIYQEVDLKDSALAATSKEYEESKEKDFRLRLNIETLKLSIPRFLLKVTKEQQTIPTESQLPDAIVKLEDELTKLIKTIGSALLKDATPDDLALMTQQGSVPGTGSSSSDAQSEFSRLQRLPGFSRLQRQLFFNLMTAKPDVSKQNIRINQIGKVKKPKSTSGSTALVPEVLPTKVSGGGRPGSRGSPYKSPSPRVAQYGSALTLGTGRGIGSSSVVDGIETMTVGSNYGAVDNDDDDGADPALSRETIKNISRLIYERDHTKN